MAALVMMCPLVIPAAGVARAARPAEQTAEWGSIQRLMVPSPQLNDTIAIDVLLPEGYTPENQYPVIYMHDGQNLYDAATTWNHQAWEIDRACRRLVKDEGLQPVIVVGIHSDPARRVAQLMPQKAVERTDLASLLSEVKLKGEPILGDQYASFVVNTLKPLIDSTYSTLSDPAHTAVMGSSMGGLMSLYLICEYPEVFGAAGCLSTHWYGSLPIEKEFGGAMIDYVQNNLPDPSTHRLYFDHGTTTIDAYYGPWETRALLAAQERGYRYGINLDSFIDYGAPHEESAWAGRVDRPLRFIIMSQREKR